MSAPRRLALVLLALALPACGSTRSAVELPRDPTTDERAIADRLVQLDPRSGESQGERYLELVLENRSHERVVCRCAPEWLDAKGQVTPARDWQSVDLEPGANVRMRFAPMPASARSHRLRFDG
jgi:hypothetical protein